MAAAIEPLFAVRHLVATEREAPRMTTQSRNGRRRNAEGAFKPQIAVSFYDYNEKLYFTIRQHTQEIGGKWVMQERTFEMSPSALWNDDDPHFLSPEMLLEVVSSWVWDRLSGRAYLPVT